MIYTEAQKEIIRGIANRNYTNIWEYLLSITPEADKKVLNEDKTLVDFNWHVRFWNEKNYAKKYRFIRMNCSSDIEKKLLDFIATCQELCINNLLLTMFPYGYFKVDFPQSNKDNISQRIFQLLTGRLPSEPIGQLGGEITRENFIPLPALQEFIKNDFKTIEELKIEEQTKYLDNQLRLQKEHHNDQLEIQNTSLNWTKGIAITGIILSLITICLTIYNNSQPSDRNVTLKNPTDTIRVINITPSRVISKDSALVDSTNNK